MGTLGGAPLGAPMLGRLLFSPTNTRLRSQGLSPTNDIAYILKVSIAKKLFVGITTSKVLKVFA